MANLNGFNAATVDPSTPFDPIPADRYLAAITESEFKATKSGTGRYLQLAFTILEGPHKNRVLWSRLNLENANQTAVKIAQSELSAICRAVGVMTPKDSAELHNLPLTISVRLRKRQDNGELANEISGYGRKEAPAPAAAPAEGSTPPWRRG